MLGSDMTRICAILSTLAEIPEGASAGTIYTALGMAMGNWERARDMLLQGECITIQSHWVKITPKGAELAKKIDKVIASGGK